jgi:hypothetical protein
VHKYSDWYCLEHPQSGSEYPLIGEWSNKKFHMEYSSAIKGKNTDTSYDIDESQKCYIEIQEKKSDRRGCILYNSIIVNVQKR